MLLDPAPTVLVAFTCGMVLPAQEGAPYASGDDVVVGGVRKTDLLVPGPWHGDSLSFVLPGSLSDESVVLQWAASHACAIHTFM